MTAIEVRIWAIECAIELNERGVLSVGQILESAAIFTRFVECGETAIQGETFPATKH